MVVDWALTAVFAALALPCVVRLVRLDYARLGHGVRHGDLAELLLVVAMVAMFSPVGGPIPAAGWQAVLALAAGWFAVAWWRRRACAHHALSAAAMGYMVTAMPHQAAAHGPWLTMSTMDARLALPLVAVAAAGYFVIDAARTGVRVVRGSAVVGGGGGIAGAGTAAAGAGAAAAGAEAAGAGAGAAGAGAGAVGAGATAAGAVAAGAGAAGVGAAGEGAVAGQTSRAICRAIMGAGMGYMLLASAL
ncbi:DUF5134 domain-containing protein [Amycolatopsis sp. NPDC003865]